MLKILRKCRPNQYLSIDTKQHPPFFSLDSTFNRCYYFLHAPSCSGDSNLVTSEPKPPTPAADTPQSTVVGAREVQKAAPDDGSSTGERSTGEEEEGALKPQSGAKRHGRAECGVCGQIVTQVLIHVKEPGFLIRIHIKSEFLEALDPDLHFDPCPK